MDKIVKRREQIEEFLLEQDEPQIILHPSMAERYKKEVAALTAALNKENAKQEASERIRGLIDKIVLTPKSCNSEYTIDLHGELASILSLASGDNAMVNPLLKQFSDISEYEEEFDDLIRDNSVTLSFQISKSHVQGINGCGSRI